MKLAARLSLYLFCLLGLLTPVQAPALALLKSPQSINLSVVRIETTSQSPDYRAPWNAGEISDGIGTGLIIEGHRILTNAHIVSDARFINLSKEGNAKPFVARVLFVALPVFEVNFLVCNVPIAAYHYISP